MLNLGDPSPVPMWTSTEIDLEGEKSTSFIIPYNLLEHIFQIFFSSSALVLAQGESSSSMAYKKRDWVSRTQLWLWEKEPIKVGQRIWTQPMSNSTTLWKSSLPTEKQQIFKKDFIKT